MRTSLLLLLFAGCSSAPPGAEDARTYVSSLEPLVYENGLLAQGMLGAAADVHDSDIDSAPLVSWWKHDFAPLSQHLAHQAAAVTAPPEWSARHQQLVTVWEMRAASYAQLDLAVTDGNAELWTTGRAAADTAKIGEEAWFRNADESLAPFGLALDQYP
ncbi:MAG: hypothetical protein ACJATT_000132 [Myxococcota bacterium]|jgi:hypothetical protein